MTAQKDETLLRAELDKIEQEMLPAVLQFSKEERELALVEPDYPDPEGEAIAIHNQDHLPPFGPQPDCKICQEEGTI